jgi:hypothetical protein
MGLFIYGVFKDDVSSSGYIATNTTFLLVKVLKELKRKQPCACLGIIQAFA